MNIFAKIIAKLENDISFRVMIKIIMVLLVIFLLQLTGSLWASILAKLWIILKPFVYGFVIAYVVSLPAAWGAKHGVDRKIMIPIIYVVLGGLLYVVIASVIPLLINKAPDFINAMINGINWLYRQFTAMTESESVGWIKGIVDIAVEALSDLKLLIPDLSVSLPALVSYTLSGFTTVIFTAVISVYLCFSWDKVRAAVYRLALSVSPKGKMMVKTVGREVSEYLRSLLILMIVRFFEYALVYFLIGNDAWVILGVLTSFSLIVPYVGPAVVNVLGIITSLSLPGSHVIALIIVLVVLSQIDGAIIDPFVHARNTSITPLWAIFAVLAGNALLGVAGVIIAIPSFLAIRALIVMMKEESPKSAPVKDGDAS